MNNHREEFQAAANQYYEATEQYDNAAQRLIALKGELFDLKERQQSIEDDVLLAGGHEDIVIDGKNAETRTAQLRAALRLHKHYEAAVASVVMKERAIAHCEATRIEFANKMAMHKREMDFERAMVELEAAVTAGHGLAREAVGVSR